MKRLIAVSALSCVALLSACGESSSAGADAGMKVEDLFPADNAVAGWSQDLTVDSKAGPAVFSDQKEIDKHLIWSETLSANAPRNSGLPPRPPMPKVQMW